MMPRFFSDFAPLTTRDQPLSESPHLATEDTEVSYKP